MTNKIDEKAPQLSKQIPATPIGDGDAGLVFKADGLFYLFNTFDLSDLDAVTDQQRHTMLILDAFSVAVQHPEILDVLIEMANNPQFRGTEETPSAFRAKH